MASAISAELRRLVAARADYLCEYCLIHEEDRGFGCQIDHILSEKHGGLTHENNLAYACPPCNRAKGSDIASIAEKTGSLTRLYNPRVDIWSQHFRLDVERIVPLSEIGEVTVKILRVNDEERCLEREILRQRGRYPSVAAVRRIAGVS
jgi:hypothetical protein